MHERSLVRDLLRQLDDLVIAHAARGVKEVHLCVGEFSGIDLDLLRTAFSEMARDSSAQCARFIARSIPLTGRCQDCRHEFFISRFRFECPRCLGRSIAIVGGEELLLESVVLEADG